MERTIVNSDVPKASGDQASPQFLKTSIFHDPPSYLLDVPEPGPDSEGGLRNLILIGPHVDDWRRAVASINSVRVIDETRVAVEVKGNRFVSVTVKVKVGCVCRYGVVVPSIYAW